MSWSQKISMTVCVLFGFLYFVWVAWTEGWSFWLIALLVAIVGGGALVAHRLRGVSGAGRSL